MADPRKPSFIEKLSKKVFLFIWFFIKKTNPNTARRLLYWGITDQAFLTEIPRNPVLNTQALGKTFQNPIGISAGFDNSFKSYFKTTLTVRSNRWFWFAPAVPTTVVAPW